MLETFQKTILKKVLFKGIGLHSGLESEVKILPADINHGIKFKRTDLNQNNLIEVDFKNVSSAQLCTTLTNNFNISVSTVEHLLAAIYITGIDNALIEINNSEVPIMDGSSKKFVETINEVGVIRLNAKRKYLKIVKKLEFNDNEKFISIEPNDEGLKVDFQLVYSNDVIGNQRNQVDFANTDLTDVYTSRTFCLFEDIEKIKKIGLAKGGSLENAVVVKNKEILNTDGLRNKKEFVNHKILDLAGDFVLSGYRVLGKVICYQGGHELTHLFLRKLLKEKIAFLSTELKDNRIPEKTNSEDSIRLTVNA